MRKKGLWFFIGAILLAVATGIITILSGGSYTCTSLEALWVEAGGNPAAARMAAGIAMSQSAGKTTATNHDTNGTTDYGLWQINSVNGGSIASFVPLVDAEQAVSLYNRDSWSPWNTGNSAC